MKSIRVTDEVQAKMREAAKKVAVKSGGEITTINGSLEYILDKFLKEK